MSSDKVIVPLRGGSDGDVTHRPTNPVYTPAPESAVSNYLEKLGTLWMKSRGDALPGIKYRLDRLPAGYEVMGRPRPKDGRFDYYLYGNPRHASPYDSPNMFFPHFKHLMDNGGCNIGCPCVSCAGKSSKSRSSSILTGLKGSPSVPLPKGRQGAVKNPSAPRATGAQAGRPRTLEPGMNTSRVDEEGTPDIYRLLINKLKKEGTVDEPIKEILSMDWRAEQECMAKLKEELKGEGQKWLPRPGEIVLFVREMPKDVTIVRDPKSRAFKLYDEVANQFLSYPEWEAGLVGQPPVEQTIIDDLVMESEKEWCVVYSGIRVEPLPNINSSDKSLSKQYKYVALHQTRPFVFWKEFLSNVPESDWHPTIENALIGMTTMSLIDKHRFQGSWPEATIYCSAIHIGSELIAVGDAVRLLPLSKPGNESATCTQILVVTSIRLKLTNLNLASDNDYDDGRPYQSKIILVGKGYTIDQSRSSKEWLSMEHIDLPEVMRGYKEALYPLHRPSKDMVVPFSRFLGRLYDYDSLYLRSLTDEQGSAAASLDLGREGVFEARAYARVNDERIVNAMGSKWFWGDSRAEALDLQTVNGLEVSKYQPERERNPKKWRQEIKVMEAAEKEQQRLEEQETARQGRNGLRGFMASAPPSPKTQSGIFHHDLPVRSGSARPNDADSRAGSILLTTESTGTSSIGSGNKRRAVVNLSDNEEEIRKQTKFLNDANAHARVTKKVAVMVKPVRKG